MRATIASPICTVPANWPVRLPPTANGNAKFLDPSIASQLQTRKCPGRQNRPPSCANSHSIRHTAKHVVVTPELPTALTMAARRTSRAAAKRAQQALGTSFFRVFTLRSLLDPSSLDAVLVLLSGLEHERFCTKLFRFIWSGRALAAQADLKSRAATGQRQSRQLRGSA